MAFAKVTKAVFPVAGPGQPLPARHQGEPQGDAADRRQAADPVCRRGGRCRRHHRHDLHHREQQARDRGPFRQGLRAGDRTRGTGQACAARDGAVRGPAGHQLHLYPPVRGARVGARDTVRGTGGGQRTVRRAARGRPDRCEDSRDPADGGRGAARGRIDDRRHERAGGGDRQLGHRRGRPRSGGRTHQSHPPHGREAQARDDAIDAGGGRALCPVAAHISSPAHDAARRRGGDPVDRRPRALLAEERVVAYAFEGRRYDCGNKLGYLEATVELGLKHPEVGAKFAAFLKQHP